MTIPPHTRLAIDWTCLSFAYCVFVLRLWALYTRGRGRIHYLNEFFLTLVTVMSTISGIMGTWRMSQAMRYAYMKSDPPVGFIKTLGLPYDVAVVDQKLFYVQLFMYDIIIWLNKGSWLATYFEIRSNLSKKMKWMLYGVTGVVVVTFFAITITNLAICLPVERNWSFKADHCSPYSILAVPIKTAIINIFTDICLFALPITIVRKLNMGGRERVATYFCFGIGTLTIATAITRLIILVAAWGTDPSNKTDESSANFSNILYIVSEVEMTLAFTAACLPAMRVLLRPKSTNKVPSYGSYELRGTGRSGFTSLVKSVTRSSSNAAAAPHNHIMVETTVDVAGEYTYVSSQTDLNQHQISKEGRDRGQSF